MRHNEAMSNYTKRSSYDYHADTVAMSDHAWERHAQRLTMFTAEEQATIKERAVAAAAHPKNREHTGVRIFTGAGKHVWAVVAGRTVKTILTTPEGTHVAQTSPCNRYAVVA